MPGTYSRRIMVEIFRTNVDDAKQAEQLLDIIHQEFTDCHANFDLEDCDRILRIKSNGSPVQPPVLISLLKRAGVEAEVLS